MSDRGVRRFGQGLANPNELSSCSLSRQSSRTLTQHCRFTCDAQQFFAYPCAAAEAIFFSICAALADDHTLMALSLAVDVHIDVDEILVWALLEALHHHCDAVGNLRPA